MPHPYGISAVALDRDGQRILTGSKGQTVQIWEAQTWKPLGAPMRHQGEVNSVAFVPGNPLLVSGSDDNTARFLVRADESLGGAGTLPSRARYSGIALSPDGKTLATASHDNTAKLWVVPLPVTEVPEDLTGWVQYLTGLAMDERGSISVLKAADWQSRRDHFADLPSLRILRPRRPTPLSARSRSWSTGATGTATPAAAGRADRTEAEHRPATPEQLAGWVKQLADKDAKTRTEAAQALEEVGPPALKVLDEAANHPDAAVRQRVKQVQDRIAVAEAVAPRRVKPQVQGRPGRGRRQGAGRNGWRPSELLASGRARRKPSPWSWTGCPFSKRWTACARRPAWSVPPTDRMGGT